MQERATLTVRRSTRFELSLPVRLRLAESMAGLVTLGPGAGLEAGWAEGLMTNFSAGGCGVMTRLFLPRGAQVRLQLDPPVASGEPGPATAGRAVDGEPGGGASPWSLLDVEAEVARVVMTDRRPGYLIGLSFLNLSDEAAERMMQLLADVDPEVER